MKYFYTDPIKALWMYEHYGMQFMRTKEYYRGGAFHSSSYGKVDLFFGISDWFQTKRFDINPDCHEILEPQCDDIGISANDITCEYSSSGKWIGDLLLEEKKIFAVNPVEIIRRNGKAFFTPERED